MYLVRSIHVSVVLLFADSGTIWKRRICEKNILNKGEGAGNRVGLQILEAKAMTGFHKEGKSA